VVGGLQLRARWDGLVDPVEDLVAHDDVRPGGEVIELLGRARPDDDRGHRRMGTVLPLRPIIIVARAVSSPTWLSHRGTFVS
jgi:hypothetical protein